MQLPTSRLKLRLSTWSPINLFFPTFILLGSLTVPRNTNTEVVSSWTAEEKKASAHLEASTLAICNRVDNTGNPDLFLIADRVSKKCNVVQAICFQQNTHYEWLTRAIPAMQFMRSSMCWRRIPSGIRLQHTSPSVEIANGMHHIALCMLSGRGMSLMHVFVVQMCSLEEEDFCVQCSTSKDSKSSGSRRSS